MINEETFWQKVRYPSRSKKLRVILFHKGSHLHKAKEYLSQFRNVRIVDLDTDVYTYISKERIDEFRELEKSNRTAFENIVNPIKEKVIHSMIHSSKKGFRYVVVFGSDYRMFRNFGVKQERIVALVPELEGEAYKEIAKDEEISKHREQLISSGVNVEYYKDVKELTDQLISFLSLPTISDGRKRK